MLFCLGVGVLAGAGLFYLDQPSQASPAAALMSARFPICGSGRRHTCIVDGDTVWLDGEKMRLKDINAPEISEPSCSRESKLGKAATRRLQEILNGSEFGITRHGFDRYGRTLVLIHIGSGTAGDILVREGLAHRWEGYKRNWC